MNKLTTVLTLTSLTAALSSTFTAGSVQADTSSLNQSVVAQAEQAGPSLTPEEQGLFSAINAVRQANGLPAVALDPALIEPARYVVMDQVVTQASGYVAFLGDGATSVPFPALVGDFGASAAGLQTSVFDNQSFTSDTPVYNFFTPQTDASGSLLINWNGPPSILSSSNLIQDWLGNNYEISRMLLNPAVTRMGVGTVHNGSVPAFFGSIPIIKWALFTGKGPVTVTTGGAGTGGKPPVVAPPVVAPPVVAPPVVAPPVVAPPVVAPPVVTPPVVTPPVVVPPPTVAQTAAASPSAVTGTTVSLSTLGAYAGGESGLTYTWAVTSGPSVTFTANATNAAKNTTAQFTQPGAYTFQVTIADAKGEAVTSSVNVTVSQTLSAIVVTPGTATVKAGATQQYSVTGIDQFGGKLAVSPTWSVNSGGSISSSGLFTAAGSASGVYTVTATSGNVSAQAGGTITAAPAAPPSLYSILAGKYDKTALNYALAAGPSLTPEEQGLFSAINAVRQANGLPAVALDPALIEPARYVVMDQVVTQASGYVAFLGDGATSVPFPALVGDFGASAAGLQTSVFDNQSFTSDTPVYNFFTPQTDASGSLLINWNGPPSILSSSNLIQDWLGNNYEISRMLLNPAVTRMGVGTVHNGSVPAFFGSIPIIKWALFTGH